MMSEKLMLVLIFLSLLMFTIHVQSASSAMELYTFKLPNGIKTIIKRSSKSPVVAIQVWVKAGSIYENDSEAGITHFIEHMIFKGTERRKLGEIAREIESLGGSINAFTSLEYTCYHTEVPSEHFEKAMDVLSDAIFNPLFDKKEIEREKEVILEEIKMREDRPQTRLSRLTFETVYEKIPYKRPIIGYDYTIKKITRDDILNYVKRRYTNDNLRLIIVGDIDLEKAKEVAIEKFAKYTHLQGKEQTNPDLTEPPQKAPRIKVDEMDIQQYHMAVAFSGLPPASHKDTPTLDVLASYLTGGYSATLIREIRDKKMLVQSIHASSFNPQGSGFFEIEAILQEDKILKAYEEILYEILKLKYFPPNEDDLQRAKINVLTNFIYSLETMEGDARKIGMFEMLTGDPLNEKKYIDDVKNVKPADIKRVVNEYFKPENVNLIILKPTSTTISNLTSETLTSIARSVEERLINEQKNLPQKSPDNTHITHLSSGLKVIVKEIHDVPTVACQIAFWGGLRYENENNNGIFNLLAQIWNRGTKNYPTYEFMQEVDKIGAILSGYAGQNTFGINAIFLSDYLKRGLELFSEMLLNPTFPEEEIQKIRPVIISSIMAQDDNLVSLAINEFRKKLFSPHPYSMRTLGTLNSINAIKRDDILLLWQEYVRPDNAVLTIIGDVKKDELIPKLEELLGEGRWKATGTLKRIEPNLPEAFYTPKVSQIKRDKQQVHIVLGFQGVGIHSNDRAVMEVLNAILAGQSGRLFTTLRDQEGLAYSVTSFVFYGIETGYFALYIGTSPEKREDALRGMWREITNIQNNLVSDEELARAKNWISGNYILDLQTNLSKAIEISTNELFGLGHDYSQKYLEKIKSVTKEDVLNAAKKYLSHERYVLVEAGQLP